MERRRPADELAQSLGGGPPQLREQLTPSAEQGSEQPRDRQDDVAVRKLGEHLLAQPFGPQRRAEGPAAAREGAEHAATALGAPEPSEVVLEQTAAEELPQYPLHDRSQRPVLAGEASGPEPQQLIRVAADELEERRVARLSRPVEPARISTPSLGPGGEARRRREAPLAIRPTRNAPSVSQ